MNIFKLFVNSYLGFISRAELRDKLIDDIYRIDAGLWEFEREYKNIKSLRIRKKLRTDMGYNQLQGKFTVILALFVHFNLELPTIGDRIKRRIKTRGGKLTSR